MYPRGIYSFDTEQIQMSTLEATDKAAQQTAYFVNTAAGLELRHH